MGKSKIVDVICFNGEYDLFDLRYNILKEYVDEFIVVEFDKTFSGRDKVIGAFPIDWMKLPKVSYHFIDQGLYYKYKDLAESSPNTIGAEHWKREFMQKESIKDCLTHLNDNDIVFIGDCDEIWKPDHNSSAIYQEKVSKLKLIVYTYWLNSKSTEEFYGTICGFYKDIKNECLNHLRVIAEKSKYYHGWHFTSMAKSLKQKLKDSYTDEDYATDNILDNLDENIKNNKDFLGRDFTFKIDETDWPEYLKQNKEKYRHLLK